MNFFVAFTVLASVIVIVHGEECTTNADCTATQCTGGANAICQHPDGAGVTTNGGLCTCTSGGGPDSCTIAADCYTPAHPELDCENNARHCYDGHCICDRFIIGG